jgi:type I restriction enzyme, S subunit
MEVIEPSAVCHLARSGNSKCVPPDWVVKPLSELVVFLDGMRRPVKEADRAFMRGDIPYYGASGVVDYVDGYLFDEELVLLSEDGENIISRNLPLAFRVTGKVWVNNHAHVLRPRPGVDARFIAEVLESLNYEQFNSGTAQPKLNKQAVANLALSVPSSSPEQSLIADALTDTEALIDSLKQLLTKKLQIKQGAMQELLTGKRRLPGFSGEWKMSPLGDLARIKTGSMNNQDKVVDGAYPFFVRSQTVEQIDTFTHDCEAILIPGEGGIGSIFHYVNGRFALHQRVYGITEFSVELLGRFLFFYVRVFFGAHAMQNSVKATVDSLRRPTFLDFEVRVPPTMDEQAAIVKVLSDLEDEAVAIESRLTKARALKQAMAQALLTGKIRLI